ncbi:hypothetical protein Bequi_09905 [Brachybacterium sp. JHP9]|uniref:Uncharacterized protein n=1 Tax=Brachybacterium equifaecis TaxID=2910770 RepID=A0ABT0R194_9MICO|nr:hypothetical protein [Brachybacterium equifaecis]MCL6423697.1 hypothetical protein [Brachybacterium equifaecis]
MSTAHPTTPMPAEALSGAVPAPAPGAPLYSTRTGAGPSGPTQDALDLLLAAEHLHFTQDATIWAYELGASEERVRAICRGPEEEWLADSGEVLYVIGDGIGLTISVRDGSVLAVRAAEHMDSLRPRKEQGIPRGHGGSGRRYPTTPEDLRQLLLERGFTVELAGNGHYDVRRDGGFRQISATPSDYRTLLNEIKSLEKTFEVSLARTDRE